MPGVPDDISETSVSWASEKRLQADEGLESLRQLELLAIPSLGVSLPFGVFAVGARNWSTVDRP